MVDDDTKPNAPAGGRAETVLDYRVAYSNSDQKSQHPSTAQHLEEARARSGAIVKDKHRCQAVTTAAV
jgi:hypothetical protein